MYPYPSNPKEKKKFMFLLKLSTLLVSKNIKTSSIKNKIIFGLLKIIPRNTTNKWSMNIVNKLLTYTGSYDKYIMESSDKGFNKEWFNESTLLEFEGTKYSAPKEYDKVLTSMYGDYMTPPKEKDRVGHGDIYLSFDKNYEDLIK